MYVAKVRSAAGGSDMNTELLVKVSMFALSMQLFGCTQSEVSFSADVQPIFKEHCIECHNGDGEGIVASGFSVRDYDSVMRGTKFGPVVIPNSSISSSLYLLVAQRTKPEIHMPPHHAEALAEGRGSPLSDDDVGTIATWIDQGAKNN